MAGLDIELVRHALDVARKHGFAEVELGFGDDSFTAQLAPGTPVARPSATSGVSASAEPVLQAIKASQVGYYMPAKDPLAPGLQVKKGDLVAVIAALGIANDVESKVAGEVVEVLVEEDQPVEYGQVLAWVKP